MSFSRSIHSFEIRIVLLHSLWIKLINLICWTIQLIAVGNKYKPIYRYLCEVDVTNSTETRTRFSNFSFQFAIYYITCAYDHCIIYISIMSKRRHGYMQGYRRKWEGKIDNRETAYQQVGWIFIATCFLASLRNLGAVKCLDLSDSCRHLTIFGLFFLSYIKSKMNTIYYFQNSTPTR